MNPGRIVLNHKYSLYNRNIGVEYNLASSNNIWTGKVHVAKIIYTRVITDNSFGTCCQSSIRKPQMDDCMAA